MLNTGPKERIWITSFNDAALKEFYAEFVEMEADPFTDIIPIVISSYGGSLDNMLAMRDLIKSTQKAVSITAIGKAMSAGSALLAAGTKGLRFIAPNTNIMIHEAAAGVGGKIEDMKATINNLDQRNATYVRLMAEDMGKDVEWLKKEISKRKNADWFLTAEDAIRVGLADKISVPRTYLSPPRQMIEVVVDDRTALKEMAQTPKKRQLKKPIKKQAKKSVKKNRKK